MEIGRIEGCDLVLGAPKDWDPIKEGPCAGLPVKVIQYDTGAVSLKSCWIPTPEEVARIAAGAHIYLDVMSTSHPPVSISVGDPPSD